jgi:type I restriction enzyme R subunit
VPYQIYKAKTVKTAAEGGFEVKPATSSTGRRWTPYTKIELEKLFGGNKNHHHRSRALERKITIPSATAPSCASSAR